MNLNLSVGEEVIDLGTKVVGTEIIHNARTRNIEIVGKRLKPNTKYYVFMENQNVSAYCVPKLLPITMTRGSFEEGDIVKTTNGTKTATNAGVIVCAKKYSIVCTSCVAMLTRSPVRLLSK